jgi:2-oxoisovalerate dehydrogenase E1 component alpha subunit
MRQVKSSQKTVQGSSKKGAPKVALKPAKQERQARSQRAEKNSTTEPAAGASVKKPSARSPLFRLDVKTLLQIHDHMVKARCLEEREIRMYKQNDGYFWIGGPGEEAFQIPLGMQVQKGEGKDYDYLHLHYRSSGILTAMGILEPIDAFRQMKNTANDPFSGGRNFANHFSFRRYNVPPIASTIETQYATAIGSGIAQKAHGGTGITIVNGGDAGTAEGEFSSCLVWASREDAELPILIIVANNEFGISTPYKGQHPKGKQISDIARGYGIPAVTIDGNDVETSWFAIKEAMDYIRTERKPYFIECKVSRLYGHSSASGCNFRPDELDCLVEFEKKLEKAGILSRKEMDLLRKQYEEEFLAISKQVREEPLPDPSTIYDHTFYGQKGRYW